MTSIVEICNLALVAKLGQKRIAALNENSVEARACSAIYEHARNFVTADHNWRHAMTIADLAELVNDREGDWAYRYQRPSDCLRLVNILSETGLFDPRYPIRREVKGSSIYTDEGSARIEYLQIVTDPTQFSPAFINALSTYMAALLVQPLQLDANLHLTMMQKYRADRDHAVTMDGAETIYQLDADEALPDWMMAR